MFGIVIDRQGVYMQFEILSENKLPKFYTLKDGESIIEEGWSIANGMNKPMWNGTEWIDTDPLPPQPPVEPQPNEMEILSSEVEKLKAENKLLNAQVEALSATTDFQEDCLAEMAMLVYA